MDLKFYLKLSFFFHSKLLTKCLGTRTDGSKYGIVFRENSIELDAINSTYIYNN